MADVSDRTLAFLMVVAFLVTIGSVGMILHKVGVRDFITGYQTSNETHGRVNVSISASVAVTLFSPNMSFGSGVLDTDDTLTYLNSSAAAAGDLEGSGFSLPAQFRLRNDGNVFVNVTINGSSPADFFGGTTVANINYSYAAVNATGGQENFSDVCTDAFDGSDDDNFDIATLNTTGRVSGITFSPTAANLCPNMSYLDINDEFNMTVFLIINSSMGEGDFTDSIVFIATSHDHGST